VRWLHGLIALLSKPLAVWAEDIVAMWALAVLAPVIARFVAGMGGYVVWCDVGTNGFLLLQQLFVTTMAAGGIGVLEMSMMEKKISIFLLCSSIYLVTLGNLIDSILALLVNQH